MIERRQDGARREQLRQQLQILDHVQGSIITLDVNARVTGWNHGAERLFGYTTAEAIGRHVAFIYADDNISQAEVDAEVAAQFAQSDRRELEVLRRRKNGQVFWASLLLSPMQSENGETIALIAYLTDITERHQADEMSRLNSRIFRQSQEGIMITDADKEIVSVNPAFCRITGYQPDELINKNRDLFRSNRHEADYYKRIRDELLRVGYWQGELWSRRRDGEIFPAWASIGVVRDASNKITNTFFNISDITERKRAEGAMHQLAYYDDLTNLPNRALFRRLLDQALLEAQRLKLHGALLFIDLNRFKPINDTLGHTTGDKVLHEVADRLRNCLRGADVVARLGGDEFVVALFDTTEREHAALVAQKLVAELEVPLVIDDTELALGAAIGIAVYPDDATDADTLLRLADIAMYRAKKSGTDGFCFYSNDMNLRAVGRLSLEAHLRRGIERHELQLHYQPKVSLVDGKIIGAEALVRWQNPERGMVSPGDFIPLAEETGLVVQITHWVLEETCAQASRWQQAGLPPLRIAVNLSARDFSPGLPQRIVGLLERHGLSSDWLELEITEGMLMNNVDQVINMMDQLKALDINLSLDDFGTGYSSLSYLKRFPIHTLKIDRSFVMHIPKDLDDCAIAGAIVSMSKALKHKVIAEGVESIEQLDFLRQLGCDEIQGYLFSAPVNSEKFEAMVREGKSLAL
ncbi:MAG: EAL domain-containing protein [Rhodocyclaceae bacterium]|nr:EAL domain-containing protein [Rhodocyclaceae bacterium]